MKTKIKEEWDLEFTTHEVIGKPVARIYLGDESCIRLIRMPDGLHAFLSLVDSPFVHDVVSSRLLRADEIKKR